MWTVFPSHPCPAQFTYRTVPRLAACGLRVRRVLCTSQHQGYLEATQIARTPIFSQASIISLLCLFHMHYEVLVVRCISYTISQPSGVNSVKCLTRTLRTPPAPHRLRRLCMARFVRSWPIPCSLSFYNPLGKYQPSSHANTIAVPGLRFWLTRDISMSCADWRCKNSPHHECVFHFPFGL
jgi:hypothetical protein